MKKNRNSFLLLIVLIVMSTQNASANDELVREHKRSNGTVVESYYRTEANETINDNYSTKGNVNPYTGKKGTVPRNPYGYSKSCSNQNENNPYR